MSKNGNGCPTSPSFWAWGMSKHGDDDGCPTSPSFWAWGCPSMGMMDVCPTSPSLYIRTSPSKLGDVGIGDLELPANGGNDMFGAHQFVELMCPPMSVSHVLIDII
ncbi:unnamed protein product [Sphagnum balticum]